MAAAQTTSQTRPEALTSVYGCAQVHDDAQRLACYDAAVGRLHEAESNGDIVAVGRHEAETIQRDAFGFHLPSISRILPNLRGEATPEIANEQVAVARLLRHVNGLYTFYMENGQVWTQVEPIEVRNVRPGDTVTINRAALGSFRLVGSRGGYGYRVRRDD